jgi:hypothetical protein
MPQLSSHHLGENSTALPHVAQAAQRSWAFFQPADRKEKAQSRWTLGRQLSSRANDALGEHLRHESDGMRLEIAPPGCLSSVRRAAVRSRSCARRGSVPSSKAARNMRTWRAGPTRRFHDVRWHRRRCLMAAHHVRMASISRSNASSVPGLMHTARLGSPTAQRPVVYIPPNFVVISWSPTLAGREVKCSRLKSHIVKPPRRSRHTDMMGCH